jgi:hypothetical protein
LFASLLQQSDNGLTARTQLLDRTRMIPVNSRAYLQTLKGH